jgi:hypothetical protein
MERDAPCAAHGTSPRLALGVAPRLIPRPTTVARDLLLYRSPMTRPSRRALYRIAYPEAERPVFEVGRQLYIVLDCSELGLRYEAGEARWPDVGSEISGSIQFRRGAEIRIEGTVLRVEGGVVALTLNQPGATFYEILAEQRYLRSKGYTLAD